MSASRINVSDRGAYDLEPDPSTPGRYVFGLDPGELVGTLLELEELGYNLLALATFERVQQARAPQPQRRRVSKLAMVVDVVHDGGDQEADALLAVVAHKAEQALAEEGAESISWGGHSSEVGGLTQPLGDPEDGAS